MAYFSHDTRIFREFFHSYHSVSHVFESFSDSFVTKHHLILLNSSGQLFQGADSSIDSKLKFLLMNSLSLSPLDL